MIHWDALALVTVATLVASILVVGTVSAGILALSKAAEPSTREHPGTARSGLLRLVGYGCLVLAGCMVLFGIYLIVPQLH